MACVINEDFRFGASQRQNTSNYLTTSELLDVLPSSYDEFNASLNDLPFSVIEAIQNAFHDSQCNFHVSSLNALSSMASSDWHALNTSNESASCSDWQIQPQLVHTAPLHKQRPQTKLYTDQIQLYNYESWPKSSSDFHPLVEVSPGFIVRLRGAQEVEEALTMGESATLTCTSCQANLSCVQNAEFVLCQACRFISPVQPPRRDFCSPEDSDEFRFGGGLSLGLINSPLAKSQTSNLSIVNKHSCA
jgi:hypothetical protein